MQASAKIASVGIVGAGAMGRGIAQVAAAAGLDVRLCDTRAGAAEEAVSFAARMLRRQVEKALSTETAAKAAVARLKPVRDLAELAAVDLIVEAIVEDLGAKQELFRRLEAIVAPAAILASNTSSLAITEIASVCMRPERVAGLHFFNPVPLMALVEVVPGLRTAEATVAHLVELAEQLGKRAVRVADMPGFLVNHLGRGYTTEALRILGEGIASAADIDRIMRAAGFRMGPFELLDLTGLDVSQPVMEQVYRQFYEEPMFRPSVIGRRRLAAGLLGRKSGAGFYDYGDSVNTAAKAAPAVAVADASPIWIDPRDDGRARMLTARLAAANIEREQGRAPSGDATILIAPLAADATTTAVERRLDPRRVVAVDALLDTAVTTVMKTPLTEPERLRAIAAAFSSKTAASVAINDSPGFVAPRMLAMIVNIACGIAQQRIAAPADIDIAAKLGLAYPQGPLEWGDAIGAGRLLAILDALHDFYRDPRYRPSPWLKRRAMLGVSLSTPD